MSERVEQWLRELGLVEYAGIFAEQRIDFDVLPDLTDTDLEKLAIPLGPRKRLLKAIAALPPDPTTARTRIRDDAHIEAARDLPEAERRQLTIMFCDLVGSTELSHRLDPEDMRDVNRAYQDACKAAIERFEGYVARYMGDGVLAYFGYPRAHEDDVGRAVRAGLQLVAAMEPLNADVGQRVGATLAVRVGIATGPVVVGDLIGEGASQESAVVGETPNLAARLQAIAAQNTVAIAAATRDIAAGQFDYEDLGVQRLKGIGSPVRAWRVIGPASVESRFEAMNRAGFTPLVGRQHEIGLLLERWEQAKEGDGQLVLLSGEAGIGKSRITETLAARTTEERRVRLRYQCSPYHASSALYPVIEQLGRAAGFESEDTDGEKLDKLEALLSRAGVDAGTAASLLAPLLSIPTGDRYPRVEMTPERQKERTLEALMNQLEGLSRHEPVLFVFEDVHWADPTSLELLDLVVDRIETSAVLAVITFRPEFSSPWTDRTHVTSLTLNRFTRSMASTMIDKVTKGKKLPEEVRQLITEKTDGVPLFVEELTKSILESGQLTEEARGYVMAGPLEELTIPATLHDSLLERLDRLGVVKEVAQAAATIGRAFDHDLLAAVCSLGFSELHDAVTHLIDAGLVFRHGRTTQTSYVFKHALVRDAAYGSLLRGTRRELHGRIAAALRTRAPEIAETQPELLAHHYTEAGETNDAVCCWLQAGRRAAERSANQEAIRHLEKGLSVLRATTPSADRDREELALQGALFTPLMADKGYTSGAVLEVCARVRELCEVTGETEDLFPALYSQWAHYLVGGNYVDGLDAAEQMLDLATRHGERAAVLQAHRLVGWTSVVMGDLPKGRHHLDTAVQLYDAKSHARLALRYGHDSLVATLGGVATHQWITGHPEQARRTGEDSIAHGRDSGHAASLSYALTFAGAQLAAIANDPESTLRFARECIDLGQEQGIRSFLGWNKAMAGWARARLGELGDGRSLLEEGLNDLSRTGIGFCRTLHLTLLADVQIEDGDLVAAAGTLDAVLALIEESEERWYEAEVNRLRGEVHVRTGNPAAAHARFSRALEIARELGERAFELRAATALVRLVADGARAEVARARLASVHETFTEGFDTEDLKTARTLLDSRP